MQNLELWFNKARLPIEVEKRPLSSVRGAVNNNDIFQMSILTQGKKKIKEYFRIFKGHKESIVQVIDVDSNKQQLILLVKEPERKYMVKRWDFDKREYIEELQKTPDSIRKYLCGFDEKHLFIAELPKSAIPIKNVKDAHRILKPQKMTKKDKNLNRTKRQGEWFFIPTTHSEQDFINENYINIEKKKRIGSGPGNHHIADQILKIEDKVFVNGKINHIEHKILKLHGWYRVIRNNETRASSTSSNLLRNGIKWID